MPQQQQVNGEVLRRWIPVVVVMVGVVVGYVRLTEAVRANSEAIERQAKAMESITALLLSDTRQESAIGEIRRRLEKVEACVDEIRGR